MNYIQAVLAPVPSEYFVFLVFRMGKFGKIDGSCSMHVRYRQYVQSWVGNLKIRDHFGVHDTGGRIA